MRVAVAFESTAPRSSSSADNPALALDRRAATLGPYGSLRASRSDAVVRDSLDRVVGERHPQQSLIQEARDDLQSR
jgi:hypothetical protein